MMNSAHTLVASIAEKITLPEVYHRIRALIAAPNVKMDDFIEIINMDASLAAHVVEIANSDFFGYMRKSQTVKQALALIGFVQLHDLLLSSLAIRAFAGIPSVLINQESFWRSCVYCGITARLLAKKYMLPAGDRFFALGLLHEVGHLVMYAKIPEEIQDILMKSEQSDSPLYRLERETLGFDYGHVGSEVMKIWDLPDSYSDIARYHMEPDEAPNYHEENTIVNLARSIMLAEDFSPEKPVNSLLESANELFDTKINKEDIEAIKATAKLQVDDIIDCLMTCQKDKS
ncbi:MAG: HDOD domain-containing protein [Methylophagaceae bacterium]